MILATISASKWNHRSFEATDADYSVSRYWVSGNCLAGKTCIFSHDPAHLMNRLTVDGTNTPPSQKAATPNFQLQDFNIFPALQPGTPEQLPMFTANSAFPSFGITPPPGFRLPGYPVDAARPRSRPGSRHQKEAGQAAPSLDDTDAFPSLGSASKSGKKHHGKRGGHGHHKEIFTPGSLADIVKMAPSPGPESRQGSRKMGRNGSSTSIRNGENSATAQAIPNPKHIPWLETGDKANKAYLKARQEAIKHGGLRNKFLQRCVPL